MSKRRKPRFFSDGVLVVNKPQGPTSHRVVDQMRRRFGPAKLGHAGTLDPFADGVLVLIFNQATRLAELFGAGWKVYRGVLELGAATDTGDLTGEVTEKKPVPEFAKEKVEMVLERMQGPGMQTPPAYSAAKHQGRPLYSYARAGEKVDKPAKPIMVHQMELCGLSAGSIEFEVCCSRGTYVRSLGEDIAGALGTAGHLSSLTRRASEPFCLDEAVELDEALSWTTDELAGNMLSASRALEMCGLPLVELDSDKAWQIRQGQILPIEDLLEGGAEKPQGGSAFRVASPSGELVAVLRWLETGESRPGKAYQTIRVFPERPSGRRGLEASASAFGAE